MDSEHSFGHGLHQPRGLALTDRDVELFRWLWMLRVLTLQQLRRLGYYQPDTGRLSSLDNVRKRLRRLWKAGYLLGDTLQDTRENFYHLAQQALPALRERCGIQQRRLYKPRAETLRYLHHALLVSECAVRLVESLRGQDAAVLDLEPLGVPFYHTHAVGDPTSKKHVARFVTQEDLRISATQTFRIRPDLVFALGLGSASRLYLLEADRATESPRDLLRKQLGYHHYQRARALNGQEGLRWQRYGPVRDFRVLLVTTTTRRVTQLRRALEGQHGFELLGITTVKRLTAANAVYAPIWTVANGEQRPLLME